MFIEDAIKAELLRSESVEWSGQPDPKKIFSASDIFLIPFTLVWGGFSIFWEASVLGFGPFQNSGHEHQRAPFFFMLWGIPFVIIGIYISVGRFFCKYWLKKRTFYAVTNQRILVVTNGFRKSVVSQDLVSLSNIAKRQGQGRSGSLIFGSVAFGMSMYLNSGFDFFGGSRMANIAAFFDLEDMNRVFEIIQEGKVAAQRKQ